MRIALLVLLTAMATAHARPPIVDLEPLQIDGTLRSPEQREADRRREGSPRRPVGDGRTDADGADKRLRIQDDAARAKAAREVLEELKKTLDAMDDFNLDLATKELGGPNGRVVWYVIEMSKRMVADGGLAPAHPMEDPRTFERDAYTLERIVQLRNALAAESDAAWKTRPPRQMEEAATRTLSRMESNLVRAATAVSPEAGAATLFLLRLGRIHSPMLPAPSPAVGSFLEAQAIPSANACWSAESNIARRIPLTLPQRACPSVWPNGQPTRYPGITLYRPLGQQCITGPAASCQLRVADVAGADCFCIGPGGSDYGKVAARRPAGFLP